MDEHFWRITGHAGMDQIFERIVPAGDLPHAGVRLLLQCLFAREIDINHLIDGFGAAGADESGPLGVTLQPGPPIHYRLTGARFMFEAVEMTERPAAFQDRYVSGLAA